MDIHMWNKAAINKHLWNLCKKKDRLWIQWVHTYYVKGKHMREVNPTQASWVVRKILKAKEAFAQAGYSYDDLMKLKHYSIKHLYLKLRGDFQKVPWRKMVCNNIGCPKWLFHFTLVAHGRLYTKDRIAKWGMIRNLSLECPLCEREHEYAKHLFFQCAYSNELWTKILNWKGIQRPVGGWCQEVNWAINWANGNKAVDELYKMALAGCTNYIWQERNQRIFQGKKRTVNTICRLVVQDIHCRGMNNKKLAEPLRNLNFYP